MNSDVRIRYNNTDYDFQLAIDPRTLQKVWQVADSRAQSQIFTSEVPRTAVIPPSKEEIIDQDYFYAGAGQILYDQYAKRFYSGAIDTRVSNVVKNPPKLTKATITLPATLSLYGVRNPGAEEAATTGWTESGGTFTADGAVKNSGSYSLKLAPGGNGTFYVYQDLDNYADWKGKSITAAAYLKSDNAVGAITLVIDDGVGTTESASVNNSGFTQKSVTRTIDASATRVRIEMKVVVSGFAGGSNNYMDDVTITTSSTSLGGSVVAIEDFAGYPYAAYGKILLKWDGTDWDGVACFMDEITSLKTWGAYLFIATGYANYYWYYNGTTFTGSILSTGKMKFLSVVGGTLWGSASAYQVKSSTNPINGGSWSTATDIVNSNKTITSLIDHPDSVFVAETDGFYEVTATAEPALVPDLYKEGHASTGRNICFWKGDIFINSGYGALYDYDDSASTISTITPSNYMPTNTDMDGMTLAMDGDDEWLYAMIDNGTKIEILAGRWESIAYNADGDTSTDWRWHHLYEQTLTNSSDNVRCAKVSTLPSARYLWLGCASTTDGIYYLDIDTNMSLTGTLYTSWYQGDHKHVLKTWYSITLYTTNCDSNKTIAVSYKKEFDSSYTSLGTISSNSANTLYFGDSVVTKKLQLKLDFASNSATSSPQLEGLSLRCASRPFNLEDSRVTLNDYGEFRLFGGMETSWIHDEFADTYKNYYSITLLTQGLTSAKYITFKYKVDDETSYTTHSTLITESPYQTVYFPVDTTAKRMQVYFTISSPTDTSLIAYIIDGALRYTKRKELTFTLNLSNVLTRPTGATQVINPDVVAEILREIDTAHWPVTVTAFNKSYDVTFQKLTEVVKTEQGNKREYLFEINALEGQLE